jgi:Arc/MetJ-type ribon-helix-helix transcriptional regulator
MATKTVIRSVRLDAELNAELEALAHDEGVTVSEYIRAAVVEVAAREHRVAAHRRSMNIFGRLPTLDNPDEVRSEMWTRSARVPD